MKIIAPLLLLTTVHAMGNGMGRCLGCRTAHQPSRQRILIEIRTAEQHDMQNIQNTVEGENEQTNARQIVTEQVNQQMEQHPAEDIAIYSAQRTPSMDERIRPIVGSEIDAENEHTAGEPHQQENRNHVGDSLHGSSVNAHTITEEEREQRLERLEKLGIAVVEKGIVACLEIIDAALATTIPLTAAGQRALEKGKKVWSQYLFDYPKGQSIAPQSDDISTEPGNLLDVIEALASSICSTEAEFAGVADKYRRLFGNENLLKLNADLSEKLESIKGLLRH